MEKMSKDKMEHEIREAFSALTSGERPGFKNAKKGIEALWRNNGNMFKQCAPLALLYIAQYDEIKNPENKAAFISGLSIFYSVLADDHFNTLKDFTLKVLQDENGHVREAMVHTADWLYVSLISRVDPFVYPKGKSYTDKQKTLQAEAIRQYIDLMGSLERLIEKYDDGQEDVEYIDEMKPSTSKSLNFFWSRFADSSVCRKISEQTRGVSVEVLEKRREIEKEIAAKLKKIKSKFFLEDVLDAVYYEEDCDDLMKIVSMFDRGGDISEMQDILDLVTEAWNYFPHESLGGLSPVEVKK